MPNPILTDKSFERARGEDAPGWAAPSAATAVAGTQARPPGATTDGRVMTANGTFAKTGALFLLVLLGGAFGWSRTEISPVNQLSIPGWAIAVMFVAFALAMVCAFVPKSSPFLAPLYALLEGAFLGVISKLFEARWDGIVLQAVLVTIGVFLTTLVLYVTGVVKVTRKFQMVVLSAMIGIFLMYLAGALMSLFGVDIMFWNDPSPFGIVISVVIAVVAALNLFLNFEFIRQASIAESPKYMEWYGAFGLMVALVWLYLEVLRLLSLLRQ